MNLCWTSGNNLEIVCMASRQKMDLTQLQNDYEQKLEERKVIYEQLKPVNKELKSIEKKIKDYMRENDIESLVVGPHEFVLQTKKRLNISIEDLEGILPEGVAIEDYLKESSSIAKKRKRAEANE